MSEYLIQSDTLSDIADAIREKAGISAQLFPKSMPSYIRALSTSSSDTSEIPEYVITEGRRVASGMVAKRGANSLTAIIMSDMHEFGENDHSDATIVERYRRANQNAGQGAKVVADNINIDFFANLGDLAWGAKTSTVTDFVQSIVNARKYTYDIEKHYESFFTPGNHDTATYGYAQNGEYLSQSVTDGLIGTYRYVDFTAQKVRVICLNTAEVDGLSVSGQSGTERITGTQLQWFADSLDLSDKSDPSAWGIVILSHHPLDWGNIKPAANCLATYLEGGNYSTTHNGVAVSKNFGGANYAKIICQFHGHVHGFRVDYIKDLRGTTIQDTTVQRIAIPNACFGRNNEYGENSGADSNGIEFGEATSYDKTDDSTGKNTAFCLVSIDLNNEIIYADCYGAGYDRVISYGVEEVVTYTITNNLTGAYTSNGAETVVGGEPYSASISAMVGYELDSITVLMGGVNVTDAVVSGNNITIQEVTGNIVITATATVLENFEYGEFTNLVLTAEAADSTDVYNGVGYKNDTYISSNGQGTDVAQSGVVSTGWIPYLRNSSNVVYIKGATLDTTSDLVRIFAYNEKDYQNTSCGYANGARILDYYSVETLGDKYYKLTPIASPADSYVNYLRISLLGTGENLIVTVNETIHKTYAVTCALTYTTINNQDTSIWAGGTYSATLSPNANYQLSSVTVTMGGLDITGTAYTNGQVNIGQVTGDIVITAVSEPIPATYTNLVPTSIDYDLDGVFNGGGYMNGYYSTTDAPYYKADTVGSVVTGLIPYDIAGENSGQFQPPTIYIKGVTFDAAQSHNRIGLFRSDTKIVYATWQVANAFGGYFTLEQLGTQYYKITPVMNDNGTNKLYSTYKNHGIDHIAISANGDGDNMIVTFDEEIV